MSVNQSIFRTDGFDHACAIRQAILQSHFGSVDSVQVLASHPGISEVVVVVRLDVGKDGWLSDLNGIYEVISETNSPKPTWLVGYCSILSRVTVEWAGVCTPETLKTYRKGFLQDHSECWVLHHREEAIAKAADLAREHT